MTQESTPTAAVSLAPIQLTPPEEVAAIQPAQAQGAVKIPSVLQQQVDAQLDAFLNTLVTADVTSDEFRKKLDQAFALGRKEIADATTLSNGFTKKNFVGETDTPAYKAISEMRALFDELNPANQGDLFTARKVFGIPIPFSDRLTGYLRRYQSAEGQIAKIYEDVVNAKTEIERGVFDLGNEQKKLWSGLEKLEAANYFMARLDERLTSQIEVIRASDADRARAIESEVLYYVRQNAADVLAMQAVTINAYQVAGSLRKTGREVMNGCDRVATLGMAALSVAVTFARATGVQVKTMAMLEGSKKSIESLITSTGAAFNEHIKATTNFANNPLLGVQTLQQMFDSTFAGMDTLEKFRLEALNVSQSNNTMLRITLQSAMTRLKNDRSAAAGELGVSEVVGGIALA
ncbi:toxic anion resistance protein [Burkholderia cenocepacia]|uniref:toxic anion resistance protein n=1 Tax=Burkholderia cenocepacia TaxID=95486 RepID=UPI000AC8B807|nr:toxic anion resistance protein [Burkholderia cenocepacia]